MRGLSRLFLYLRYFFEPKDKLVRQLAYGEAKSHYANFPLRNSQNLYPRVSHYEQRRQESLAFQKAFNNSYRHTYAKNKLGKI